LIKRKENSIRLYLLKRDYSSADWDDDKIVAASTAKEARETANLFSGEKVWTNRSLVKCKLISLDKIKRPVVLLDSHLA